MPLLFFVNCERTVLFSVKRDLDPPLYHPHFTLQANNCKETFHCFNILQYSYSHFTLFSILIQLLILFMILIQLLYTIDDARASHKLLGNFLATFRVSSNIFVSSKFLHSEQLLVF